MVLDYVTKIKLGDAPSRIAVEETNLFLGFQLLGGKVAQRLVQAVRHWAKTRGCAHLMVHVTNGEDAPEADRFFRRCGMQVVGGNYVF